MRDIDEKYVSAEAMEESGRIGYEFYRQAMIRVRAHVAAVAAVGGGGVIRAVCRGQRGVTQSSIHHVFGAGRLPTWASCSVPSRCCKTAAHAGTFVVQYIAYDDTALSVCEDSEIAFGRANMMTCHVEDKGALFTAITVSRQAFKTLDKGTKHRHNLTNLFAAPTAI